jgi:hypothetical protein
VSDAAAGRVLRLAILGWGLGDLALGDRGRGSVLLALEAAWLVLVALATIALADSTWYLLPFLGGMGFIVAWAAQAVAAYRRAQRREGAIAPAGSRSPAAAAAWLTLPLLVWGTGYWLVAAGAATPSAVLDRFVTAWPEAAASGATPFDQRLADDPDALAQAASAGLAWLGTLCRTGQLSDDCASAPSALLRDVRFRIVDVDGGHARAVAELVRYERRPSRFLWVIAGTDLEPVPIATILRLELETERAPLGAERWRIVNARAG